MTTFDPSLFPDIANSIGLPSPAFVEKDYYAVQLLKTISEIKLPENKLIFAGGTCLTKAYLPTFRMSEDLDLKFLPGENFLKLSESQKRKDRSNFGNLILQTIKNSELFTLIDKESRSEGRYRYFSVGYPKTYSHNSLRSELKLEFTETSLQYLSPIEVPLSSIYASITKQEHEISALTCDNINIILIEKFLGLLRRTAEVSRGYSDTDDETLVRHIYDLYLIYTQKQNLNGIQDVFKKIVKDDIFQFGMRHKEFKENPFEELLYGMQILLSDIKYKDRYQAFLGPLVYHSNPPSWEQGIESLQSLVNILIHGLF